MKHTFIALLMCLCLPLAGNQDALVKKLLGAKIYSQEKPQKYLGKIAGEFDGESIFNKYGTHGSKYQADSIWNEYGSYGGKYSAHSPFNKYTTTPPMIVSGNKIIGYLTVNTHIRGGLAPDTLKRLMGQMGGRARVAPPNPLRGGNVASTIKLIDKVKGVIALDDGTIWPIAELHHRRIAGWKKGEKVTLMEYKEYMVISNKATKEFAFSLLKRQNNGAVPQNPNRPVVRAGGRVYPATGKGHWVKKNKDVGKTIILEDGSVWEIDPLDRINTVLWLAITDITVVESDDGTPGYNYLLINTDDKEKAHAKYLGR